MGGQAVYVGVDVSKERLDVAVRPSGECFAEANDKRAVSRLVKRLTARDCTRVVVEATGGYETIVVAGMYSAGIPVVVINPRWVRNFAKSIGWLEKTDRIDAKLLALYAERAELKVQQLPDEATRRLAELCARRSDVVDMIEAERNRLEHASSGVRREITSHIDYLRKQLKRIEHDIDGAVRGSDLWRRTDELMDSVPWGGADAAQRDVGVAARIGTTQSGRGRQAGRDRTAARRQRQNPRPSAHQRRARAAAQSALHGDDGSDVA